MPKERARPLRSHERFCAGLLRRRVCERLGYGDRTGGQVADSDRDGANRVALGLLAACKVEGRVLNHLIEMGRQAGFSDLTLDLADHHWQGAEPLQYIPALKRGLLIYMFQFMVPPIS